MARVWTREGSEGPRHDPYSWSEVHFEKTDGTVVMLRQGGLGYSRLYVDGTKVKESFGDDNSAEAEFEVLTGMCPYKAQEVPEVLRERRLRRLPRPERLAAEACMHADARMLAACY